MNAQIVSDQEKQVAIMIGQKIFAYIWEKNIGIELLIIPLTILKRRKKIIKENKLVLREMQRFFVSINFDIRLKENELTIEKIVK